jgi:DNA-binding NtrC family response regulator
MGNARALKVLVVDDEPAMREVLDTRLAGWGFDVRVCETCSEAEAAVGSFDPDVVLSDVVLPDRSGLDLLRSLKGGDAKRPVILMTAYGSIDTAVEAMKQGATDFLTKPLDYDALKALIEAGGRDAEQRRTARKLESTLDHGAGLGSLVGTSKPQRELYELIKTLGSNDANVIITGESGTGKELVAQTIHQLSARKSGPFVPVNAAAIPEGLTEGELFGHERGAFTGAIEARPGLFEQAHTGTLFLDEITEMPIALQPKFLRVLEDGRARRVGGRREISFDVRVITATNRLPDKAVEDGLLRADLYYRLNVFTVTLAPLRERKGDIPLLAQHFLLRANQRHKSNALGIRPETLELLTSYRWPGNVRQLSNTVERAVILAGGGWIEPVHLPPFLQPQDTPAPDGILLPRGITSAEAERILIMETLKEVANNKAEAARRLGLDVKTIRNKLKSYESASGNGKEIA